MPSQAIFTNVTLSALSLLNRVVERDFPIESSPSSNSDRFVQANVGNANPPIQTTVGDIGVEQFHTLIRLGRELTAPTVNARNLDDAIREFDVLRGNFQEHGLNWGLDNQTVIEGARFLSNYSRNIRAAILQHRDKNPFGPSYRYHAIAESYQSLATHLPRMTEIRNYITRNQSTLRDTLIRAVDDNYIVGIGEAHAMSSLGRTVAEVFPALAQRAHEKNEELIIALEISPLHQQALDSINYTQSREAIIRDIVRITNLAPGWVGNMADVIIGAKRAGLEVRCVDPRFPEGVETPTVEQNNERDRVMFERIASLVNIHLPEPNQLEENLILPGNRMSGLGLRGTANEQQFNQRPVTRVIFYGGSYHASLTRTGQAGNEYRPLFSLLSERFGDHVTSFRTLNKVCGFGERTYLSHPLLETTMEGFGNRIVVVPENPLVDRDPGTHHHLILDNSDLDAERFIFRN